MFTGIISAQAVLRERENSKNEVRLTFEWLGRKPRFRVGESVSVDGVCLTICTFRGRKFSADLLPETLLSTTLGELSEGKRLNVERALRVGNSAGGHWVTGHVDGMGRIRRLERRRASFRLQIGAGADIIRLLIRKGSIAVDGMSLTVQEVHARSFVVSLTPHTDRATTLAWKRVGDSVNLESDPLAKMVWHFLRGRRKPSLKLGKLKRRGF